MRIGIVLGIIVVLAVLLQGCGKKGPLKLSATSTFTSQSGKSL